MSPCCPPRLGAPAGARRDRHPLTGARMASRRGPGGRPRAGTAGQGGGAEGPGRSAPGQGRGAGTAPGGAGLPGRATA